MAFPPLLPRFTRLPTSSSSSSSSLFLDPMVMEDEELSGYHARPPNPSRSPPRRLLSLLLLLLLFLLILFWPDGGVGVRWFVSNPIKSGSSITLLISLDGFRPDYLSWERTPTLMKLAQTGIVAEYLIPSFPTLTFPNHYSLVTGLYPSQHGIVSNVFYDPHLNRTFNYTDPASTSDPSWWGGEPIWVTAERQGCITGILHWVGCDVKLHSTLPTYMQPYATMSMAQRVDTVLHWMTKKNPSPRLIGMYVPDIDQQGHLHGPWSEAVNQSLTVMDQQLNRLIHSVPSKYLEVHWVIVSDHGMAHAPSRISIDSLLGSFLHHLVVRFHGPLLCIDPLTESARTSIYQYLKALKSKLFQVYLKEEIPSSLHYSLNARIASIVLIPKVGYQFLYDTEPMVPGMHGYRMDDEEEEEKEDKDTPSSMHALFLAQGPAFKTLHPRFTQKRTSTVFSQKTTAVVVPPFQNIELYNLLCKLLHLKPSTNSGVGLPWLNDLQP
ncbi:hypothetical protein HMI54_006852 [Coelomomyces lativittatus]|nr:hypothetical protein HMI56_000185 [Coelomomyces lativittatus]KAJ1516659.1 hypothetical protein HMI55_001734 [Coelomomyces lativittatus]KAJ1517134.1 hypothetical protein HMI54_006852 [Coelomomyces lativittatus]